jgi:hypothetical protein
VISVPMTEDQSVDAGYVKFERRKVAREILVCVAEVKQDGAAVIADE